MLPDLPSQLLRSFVAVIDSGSLAVASERVGRSESALSLQMTRLEGIVGHPLFDRDGRALKLNQTGALLLAHARSILNRIDIARAQLKSATSSSARIGVVQDFVGPVLRPLLSDLRAEDPHLSISIIVGSTKELLQAMGAELIDTALCSGTPFGASATVQLPVRWFGDAALAERDVIPLVGVSPPCPYLEASQNALDASGRQWHLALLTPSLDGVKAAVEAGIGLTCRTEAGFSLDPLLDESLPELAAISYSVLERRKAAFSGAVANRMSFYLSRLMENDGTQG